MTSTNNTDFEVISANTKYLFLLKISVLLPFVFILENLAIYIYRTIMKDHGFSFTTESNSLTLLIILLPLILLFFPKLYRITGRLSKVYTFFSFKKNRYISKLFSLMPLLSELDGEWVIERNSEKKDLSSFDSAIKFYFDNISKFIIYPLGATALSMQLYLNYLDKLNPSSNGLPINAVFFSGGNLQRPVFDVFHYILLLVTLFAIVNQILWKIEDSELKVMNIKESTKGGINEIRSMYSAAKPLRELLSIILSLSAVVWFYNQITYNLDTDPNSLFSYMSRTDIIRKMLTIFLTISFSLWFLGYFYHQSGIHQEIVNEFRVELKEEDKIPQIEVNITKYS